LEDISLLQRVESLLQKRSGKKGRRVGSNRERRRLHEQQRKLEFLLGTNREGEKKEQIPGSSEKLWGLLSKRQQHRMRVPPSLDWETSLTKSWTFCWAL
jgi:hypothetical protein